MCPDSADVEQAVRKSLISGKIDQLMETGLNKEPGTADG